jgi:hypothetical protein
MTIVDVTKTESGHYDVRLRMTQTEALQFADMVVRAVEEPKPAEEPPPPAPPTEEPKP